jgi:hypothetical protein
LPEGVADDVEVVAGQVLLVHLEGAVDAPAVPQCKPEPPEEGGVVVGQLHAQLFFDRFEPRVIG